MEARTAMFGGGSLLEEHLSAPRGLGALARAPHSGAAGGAVCGDLIRVSVRIAGDRVAEAGFEASGCAAARAAGSAAVELVAGAPLLDCGPSDSRGHRRRARRARAALAPMPRSSPPTRSTARSALPPATA